MEAFWVNLKACLGLVLPALSSSGKYEAGFWVMFFHGPHSHLCGPYTVLYDVWQCTFQCCRFLQLNLSPLQ